MRDNRVIWASMAASVLAGIVTSAAIALASRNGSGTYSLPSGNPVVTGTTINSTVHNNTMSDLGTEMTDSLSRSGKGAMLAALQGYVGAVGAPGYTFAGDTNTGFYWVSADDFAAAAGGVKQEEWTVNGLTAYAANGAVATPSFTFKNDTGVGLYRFGAGIMSAAVAGANVQSWSAGQTTMSGQVVTTGGLVVGSNGTQLDRSIAASAVIDFASTTTTCNDSTGITVTGAQVGDLCIVGAPSSGGSTNATYSCYVSAADTVKVRHCAAGTADDPASATFYVRVFDP